MIIQMLWLLVITWLFLVFIPVCMSDFLKRWKTARFANAGSV